jgi:hypothetical protein
MSKDIWLPWVQKLGDTESISSILLTDAFLDSPASINYHHAYPGGLAQHTMGVLGWAFCISKDICIDKKSLARVCLLHDVCKIGLYKKIRKWRKDEQGKWESYSGYEHAKLDLPVGHGELSVIKCLQAGIKLTDEEILAIRWHMGAYDVSHDGMKSLGDACDKSLLVPILQSADLFDAHHPSTCIDLAAIVDSL